MKNNEQIAADLENNCSDYYYCMNGTKQVIRKIYRDELGKLYVTLPNWGTVPLERCPETLLRRVPTLSLEDTDDKLKERLRLTAQILIEEVGADGPMNAEDAALKAVKEIQSLKDEVKRLNSLLAANRLLTRAAIHNMFQPPDSRINQIVQVIEELEKKSKVD